MAVLSRSAVRHRIATVVDGITGLTQGPNLSSILDTMTARNIVDGRFSVTVSGSQGQAYQQRQRRSEGVETYTTVRIEFLTNLRADNMTADIDAALDRGDLVLKTVMGDTSLANLHLDYVSFDEEEVVMDQPVTRSTLTLTAKHRLALQP